MIQYGGGLKKSNHIDMSKSELKKLSKSQLIKLLLKQENKPKVVIVDDTKPVPASRTYKPRQPIPTPRKGVKQMVQDYENNIILPPLEFRDKPVPAPRKYKPRPPSPTPRTKIEQIDKALKGYTKSYETDIKNNKDPLVQLQNTRKAIEYHIIKTLGFLKGLKSVETLKVTFNKLSNGEIVYKTAYFNCKYKQS